MRLKDEGPVLSLQRDLRLPWADFSVLLQRKKSQQSVMTKAAHQQLNYNGSLNAY